MRVAIMQPYFFPYIGYFQLIKSVERFILFDDVQYIRHGWINRNRILKPEEGVQYFVAPLQKHTQTTLIKDVLLMSDSDWKLKIIRQLDHYKKKAKYFSQTIDLLNVCFNTNENNIAKFNGHCIDVIFKFLELPYKVEISSEMNFNYSAVKHAGEWALRICEQLDANEYVNPLGGAELFDSDNFKESNIRLSFFSPNISSYDQKRPIFEPSLSIIDNLMFNGLEGTKKMIEQSK